MVKPKVLVDDKAANVYMSMPTSDTIKYASNIDKKEKIAHSVEINHPNFKGEIASWGKDNKFPFKVIDVLDKSSLVRPLIEKKVDLLCSGGMVYGVLEMDKDRNKTVLKRFVFDEIERDLERTNHSTFLNEVAREQFTFRNSFEQLVLSKNKSIITQLYCHDSSEVRLSLQSQKTGEINAAIINANWKSGNTQYIKTLPAIDPYYDIVEQIELLKSKHNSVILPNRQMVLGRKYYDMPEWWGVVESGWFDMSLAIVKFKNALMDKRVNSTLHVKVNYEWWEWKYPGFAQKDVAVKKKIIQQEASDFIKRITDPDTRAQVIMTGFGYDQVSKKENWGWIIEPIDIKGSENGEHLEDSQEGDLHIMRALGILPSLAGIASKNGLGSGSGSDIRMALMMYVLSSKSTADKILRSSQAFFNFNRYSEKFKSELGGKRLVCWMERYFAATLDEGSAPKELNQNNNKE